MIKNKSDLLIKSLRWSLRTGLMPPLFCFLSTMLVLPFKKTWRSLLSVWPLSMMLEVSFEKGWRKVRAVRNNIVHLRALLTLVGRTNKKLTWTFAGRIGAAPVLLVVGWGLADEIGADGRKNAMSHVVSLTLVDDVGGVVRKRLMEGFSCKK